MPSKVFSGAITGLSSQIIEIETEVSYGLKRIDIVGLPDKAVEESKERVRTAIKSTRLIAPLSRPQRILINLAPADIKKEGSLYDLPIALAYLLNTKQISFNSSKSLFIGELSLSGNLRPIKGAFLFALAAQENNFSEIILPKENAKEAALAINKNSQLKVIGVTSLKETIDYLEQKKQILPLKVDLNKFLQDNKFPVDISWIKGQGHAKRALEIAAAGGHNLLMIGPPGGGKSLLAKSLPSILPPLTQEEILEVTKIYSAAGLLSKEKPIITQRPFRAPHHSASKVALVGGGNPVRPGEITLAHRGVLFLDEFPEFRRDALEALRQPLEDGKISLLRVNSRVTFPCQFTLVAAANPTPWGDGLDSPYYSSSQLARYKRKLSGPLVDRIDLRVELPYVKFEKLIEKNNEKSSEIMREKVKKAREMQKNRFSNTKILLNSQMEVPQIKKYCQIDSQSQAFLKQLVDKKKISTRGYHRVLKVARTIADLDNSEKILYEHLSEAVMYRTKEE